MGAVGAAVIGHEALDTDAEGSEVKKGIVEEAPDTEVGFIREDLGKGEAGSIVNGDMDILVTGAADFIAAVSGDAVAGPDDASQLLDIHVEELAGMLALIAHDGLGRLQGGQAGEAVTCQQAGDRSLGEAALPGDLEARQTSLSESLCVGHEPERKKR